MKQQSVTVLSRSRSRFSADLHRALHLIPPSQDDLFRLAAVGLAYFVLAFAGLQLASIHPSATPVWAPTGLAIAAILLWSYRIAPAIFVPAFFVNQLFVGSIPISFAIASGNTLEAVAAVFLIRGLMGDRDIVESPARIAEFSLSCLAATTISPTIGVGSLVLGNYAEAAAFWPIWLTWWLGDLAGALLVAPVIVLWSTSDLQSFRPLQIYRMTAAYAASVVIGFICFIPLLQENEFRDALTFLVVLPLLWTAVRLSPRDTATVGVIISIFAILGTLFQAGPFAGPDQNGSLIVLLAFLICVAVPALALSAEVSARQRLETKQKALSLEAEVLWQATLQAARGGSLVEILGTCLKRICRVTGWAAGHIYTPDDVTNPTCLRSGEVWYFQRKGLSSISQGTEGVELRRGEGLPGKIWASGKPMWVSDVQESNDFLSRKGLLLQCGIRAAFGFPIYTEGRLQAVLKFFSTERRPPDEAVMRIVQSIGEQLGRVIERRWAHERQSALQATLNALSLAVYFTDEDGRVVYMNQAAEQALKYGIGFRLDNGRLVPTDCKARVTFERAFDLVVKGGRRTVVPLPEDERPGLVAVMLPFEYGELTSVCGTFTAAAAVLVQDPFTCAAAAGEAFAQLYGLTPGESRVLQALSPGLSLKQAADKLGISETTAKTHLQHIFIKTGTCKQSALIHLLLCSSPPVGTDERPRQHDPDETQL